MASGPTHATLDTVALVLFSHVISHLARQSHSKAFPRRSLQTEEEDPSVLEEPGASVDTRGDKLTAR